MSFKKDPVPQAPQIGDYIKYNGEFREVFNIDPENKTFLIEEAGGKPKELGGEDWTIYRKIP